MVVKTLCKGHEVAGLDVGATNARRYFSRGAAAIELQLDHLWIECRLMPEFWDGQPEIHDWRLSLWLECKQFSSDFRRIPAHLAMIRVGENSFKLGPVSRNEQFGDDQFRVRRAPGSVLRPGSVLPERAA